MEETKKLMTDTLLQDCYKNVRMATLSTDKLQNKINDDNLRQLIDKQNDFYEKYTKKVENLAKNRNIQLKDLNFMLKMMTSMSTFFKTMFDKSSIKIASLFSKGTVTGMEYLNKSITENKFADEDVKKVAEEQVQNMQEFLNSLSQFVSQ